MTMRQRKSPQINPLSAALAFALMAGAGAAHAQTAPTEPEDKDAKATTTTSTTSQSGSLDTVTVTGSRIKRSQVEGPAPVTVISREQIDREGFQTVGDMLQSLAQSTTNSFTGDLATSGFTPNAQVVNLRNLGPGYTAAVRRSTRSRTTATTTW